MKKRLLFVLTFTCFSIMAMAQAPALDCVTSSQNVLCGGLNGISGSLPTVNTAAQPSGACNIAVHNGGWYSFVAGSASITLEIITGACIPPADCPGVPVNEAGIQSALFSGCGPNYALVNCGPANIQPNASGNFVMNGLVPGTVYHLLLDGFCNAICDFTVNTVSGSTQAPPVIGSLALDVSQVQSGSNPAGTGCIGGTFNISAGGVTGIGTYTWTLPDGTILQNAPSTIQYTFGPSGQVCVQGDNGCDMTPMVCETITGVPAIGIPEQIVKCPNEGFATSNGQIFPPNGNNVGQFETTTIMVTSAAGCVESVDVSVMYVDPVTLTPMVPETLCFGTQSTVCPTCPPVTGQYEVPGISPDGCPMTTFVDLTVLNPLAVIDIANFLPPEITCTSPLSQLTAFPVQGAGNVTYNWSGPGIVSPPNSQTIQVNQPGVYSLTVSQSINTANGLITCVSQNIDSYNIISNTSSPTASAVQTATIDCNSGCVTLDASASSSGPNIVFGWSGPNGFSSTEQNPIVCEPGNYLLTVVDANNNCPASGSPTVTVSGAAAATAMAAASNNVIDCNNTSATLIATGSTSGGTYTWTSNGTQVGVGEMVPVTNAGTYILTVDNGSGCTATEQVTITANNAAPTATIDVSNAIDCNTTSATLTANSSTTGLNYNWVDASGMSLGTGSSVTVNGAGMVTLTVTDPNNGCDSNPITATVDDNSTTVTAQVTVSGNITCTPGSSVTLEATGVSGANNPTYTWTDAGGNVLGMGTSISVMNTGTYTVQIQDPNTGCSSAALTGEVTGDTSTPTAMASASNDIDCNNTSATLDGAGSTTGTNFTYEWFDANGASAGMGISLSTMNAGTYTLVVTADNGCSETSNSVVVGQNSAEPTATIDVSNDIDCNNTSATLTANSATTGLNYNWVDAAGMSLGTGSSITVNDAVSVTLTVTDPNNGCSSPSVMASVANISSTLTAQVAVSGNVDCDGNPVTLEAIGLMGTTNPSYSWTDANGNVLGTGSSISVTTIGTYTLEVIDPASGCSSGTITGDVTGDTSTPTAMAASTNNLDCNNTMTTLSATGSSTGSNFTYTWFDVNGNSVGTGLSIMVSDPGDYTVMVVNTDNNCDATSTAITVVQDDNTPTAMITGNAALDCNTMSVTLDGSSSTTTGGNTITSYEWLDASGNVVGTSATLSVSNPGDYTLNIEQSNGCASTPVSATVVDNSTTVSVEATVSGMITCTSTTATLDASNPQGATNPTYEWFDAAGASLGMGASFPASAAGDYVLQITDPGSGCTSTATALVEENIDLPVVAAIVANNQPLTCDISEVSLDGSGSATGSDIEYNWTNASGATVGMSALINVTTPGMYVLQVSNTSSGCTNTATVTVTEDIAAPTANAGAGGTLDCGQASFTLDGGGSTTGTNISYEWFNTSGASIGTGITFDASSAGDYILVVTNEDNGCTSDNTATVVASMDVPNVGATATNNGLLTCDFNSLTLSGTSSTSGVILEWQDASGMVLSANPTLDVTTIGTYTLVATNPGNGCSASTQVNVEEDIMSPTANAGVDPTLTCADDFVSLNGSASTAGTNITYEWFDAAGVSAGVGVSVDVMAPGVYTLLVTDTDNGCTEEDIVEVMQDADLPTVVAINTNIDCNNTTASLDGTGSTTGADIAYAWVNSNGVTVSTDLVAPTNVPGIFTLTVTNMTNGCEITSTSIEVSEDTSPPLAAAVNTTGQLTCNTTSATLDGTGSATGMDIEYAWMDDMGTVISTDISFDVAAPGTYSFQVTNMTNGCTAIIDNVVVTEDVENPTAMVGNGATLTCVNNEATLDGTGSSSGSNFSYQWVDGNGDPVSADLIATVGAAGMYSLIVTNEDTGCSTTSATAVAIDQDSNIPVAMIDSNPVANVLTCANGEVVLDASGSTPSGSLTYEWVDANGDILGTEVTLTVTTPGSITLNILDTNNSCDGSTSFVVQEDTDTPTAMVAAPMNLDCNNTMTTLDGSMSSTGTNITYQWTNAAGMIVGADATLDTDVAGDYILLVTNSDNGCEASMPVSLTENFDAPTLDAGVGSTITCLVPTATLDGSGSATGATITYEWIDANSMVVGTTANLDVMIPGDYTLTVMDSSNGCSSVSNAITILEDVNLPTAEAGTVQTLTCIDNNLTLSGSGSDSGPNITYEWTNEAGMVVSTDLLLTGVTAPGTYTIQVMNSATGCSSTDFVEIDENTTQPTASAGNGGTLTCGTANFLLDGSAGSSTGPNFSYQWLDATGNIVSEEITFNAGAAGTYTFVVTDDTNGCTDEAQATIDNDTNSPTINVAPSANLLTCATQMINLDGSASVVSTNSSGTLDFAWTGPSGALGTTSTIDITGTGEYTLLVTDTDNGCSATTSITINEDTTPPVAAIVAGSGGTLVCGQDDLTLDASSSTTGSTTGTLTYTWFDEAGVMVGTGITYAATSAQTYTVEVLDSGNGCTNETTQVVQQDNNVPTISAVVQGELTCNVNAVIIDGSASTSASGSLTYEWTNASNMVVGTSATFEASASGSYTLTIVDPDNLCSTSSAFTVDENTDEPTADIQAINGTSILCDMPSLVFDGTNSSGSSTTSTLSYEWFLNGTSIGTMPDIEAGEAGTLMLVVTDSENGCSGSTSVTIEVDADVPVASIAAPLAITCTMNEVTINASGSTPGLEYSWTGPGNITNGTTLNPTVDATGQYVLMITNSGNGCTATSSVMIMSDINPPTVQAEVMDLFDCVTTEISLSGNGSATGNVVYDWTTTDGVIVSGANSLSPVISAPGTYTLMVTDNTTGCSATESVTVGSNTDVPTISSVVENSPTCFGDSDGSIAIESVTGGDAPYLYSINGSAFAPVDQFSFLEAGNYEIVVQDVNGCESTEVVALEQPGELLVELGDDQTIQLGDDYLLNPQIIGGYDILTWSNCDSDSCQEASQSILPMQTSQYEITLVDGSGCTATDMITIFVEKKREVFIPNVFTPNGDGENDFFLPFAGQEVEKIHEFRIFSRWGAEIYKKLDFDPRVTPQEEGWDGRFNTQNLNPQVFVYYVDVEFIDGRREVLRGDVALRR